MSAAEQCADCDGYTSAEAHRIRKGWQWRPGKFCSCPFDEDHPR